MPFTLGQIAEKIGAELRGDPDFVINDLATLEEAREGELSYVVSPKFRKLIEASKASAFIAYPKLDCPDRHLLILKDPYLGFARAMRLFYRAYPEVAPGIDPSAVIATDARYPSEISIGPNAVVSRGTQIGRASVIGAGAFIGENCVIGEECYIFPNVTIRENVKIGNNVVIYPNAVIGSDGFGYCWDGQGYIKIPQTGTVVIDDDVEIGAGTTIDRATLGETHIGRGCIIDNLVQIAHNCRIGEYSIICAQAGMAGTTTLERRVTLAGQVGLAGHLRIGENSIIEAQSGVAGDVPPNSVHFGTPSRDFKLAHKINAILNLLPDYVTRIRKLESQVNKEP
jgi:UDP-3-O-[3-hydroxymyristoyl] glucosamine N-acyltransferase